VGKALRAGSLVLSLGLLAAACGSADDTDEKAASNETAPPALVAEAKDFSLADPVKIVAIISSAGQDENAVGDFNDGAKLAVEEINAAGGLGGHPIVFESVATPPYGDISTSLNQAIAAKPDLILGPVSDTTLVTISKAIDDAGVPVIHLGQTRDAALGGPSGSEWMFGLRPYGTSVATVAAKFAAEELDAKSAAVLYLNATYGTEANDAIAKSLEDADVKVSPQLAFGVTATDLSKEVQQAKSAGVDVILDWGTPNTLATSVLNFAQLGVDTPHLAAGSVGFDSFVKGVTSNGGTGIIDNLYGVLDCNPLGDDRSEVQAWVQRFVSKYGYKPSYSAAEMYDAVYLLRKVVEDAESAEPAAIRDGLRSIEFTDGMCARTYKNHDNVLFDQSVVVRYQDGKPVTQQEYDNVLQLG
jgi:ABC-type branched-subunit amino acid transport system substrate-binding protein